MAVSLKKGQKISLAKAAPGLKNLLVGLGWDARATDGAKFDLDAQAFLLGADGKVVGEAGFIFYGNDKSECGSIVHLGDNRTGEGEGDDEQITVNLDGVPANVEKIAFTVTIHEFEERKQNFGMVSNAFIRVVNQDDGSEAIRYDLSEDYSIETALIVGILYRHEGEWKFEANGQGYEGGLAALATSYGLDVE